MAHVVYVAAVVASAYTFACEESWDEFPDLFLDFQLAKIRMHHSQG